MPIRSGRRGLPGPAAIPGRRFLRGRAFRSVNRGFPDTTANGALAATEATDTAAFVAVTELLGALAATEASDIAAFAGTVAFGVDSGVLAATEGFDTTALIGTVAFPVRTGALAVTEAADTAAFTGTEAFPVRTGTLAAVEGSDSAVFVGTVAFQVRSGILLTTEASDIFLGVGNVSGTVPPTNGYTPPTYTRPPNVQGVTVQGGGTCKLEDAVRNTGVQSHAMATNRPFLAVGPDGVQAWYTFDAERSQPGGRVVLIRLYG